MQHVFKQDMAQDSGADQWPDCLHPRIHPPRLPDDVHHVPMEDAILSLQDSERELIRRALEKHRNNANIAAGRIGHFRAHAVPENQRIRLEMTRVVHRLVLHFLCMACVLAGAVGCGVYSLRRPNVRRLHLLGAGF